MPTASANRLKCLLPSARGSCSLDHRSLPDLPCWIVGYRRNICAEHVNQPPRRVRCRTGQSAPAVMLYIHTYVHTSWVSNTVKGPGHIEWVEFVVGRNFYKKCLKMGLRTFLFVLTPYFYRKVYSLLFFALALDTFYIILNLRREVKIAVFYFFPLFYFDEPKVTRVFGMPDLVGQILRNII